MSGMMRGMGLIVSGMVLVTGGGTEVSGLPPALRASSDLQNMEECILELKENGAYDSRKSFDSRPEKVCAITECDQAATFHTLLNSEGKPSQTSFEEALVRNHPDLERINLQMFEFSGKYRAAVRNMILFNPKNLISDKGTRISSEYFKEMMGYLDLNRFEDAVAKSGNNVDVLTHLFKNTLEAYVVLGVNTAVPRLDAWMFGFKNILLFFINSDGNFDIDFDKIILPEIRREIEDYSGRYASESLGEFMGYFFIDPQSRQIKHNKAVCGYVEHLSFKGQFRDHPDIVKTREIIAANFPAFSQQEL
jgi:hypothetical protein